MSGSGESGLESPTYNISAGGQTFPMRYVFKAEIAALRAHKSGKFQEEVILDWIRHQKLRGTYVDVGAHVGNHSLYLLKFCNPDRLHSIEAHPKIYKILVENMHRNLSASEYEKWDSYNNAAWDKSGIWIHMAPIPHNNAGHCHVRNSYNRKGEKVDASVPSISIDDMELEGVSLLKVDVEDTEKEVIDGAIKTIKRCKPVIVIERHSKAQLQETMKQIRQFGYGVVQNWSGCHTFALRAK